MRQLAQFLQALGRRFRARRETIRHFFRNAKFAIKSPFFIEIEIRFGRTGTGAVRRRQGALRRTNVMACKCAVDSHVFASAEEGRETAGRLPVPARNDGPSSGPWFQCGPICEADKCLRTDLVQSTWRNSAPCSLSDPYARRRGGKVVRS